MTRNNIRKICLLGDGAVGKTSLVRRYVYDVFSDEYIKTFGTKVTKKVLDIEDVRLTLMIWDILGQNTNQSLHQAYYKGASGALLVSDLTREETFSSLIDWRDRLFDVTGDRPLVLVANKDDLRTEVEEDTVDQVSRSLDEDFIFTSAKTGEGVSTAFKKVGKRVLEIEV